MADVVGYFPATLAVDSSTGTHLRNVTAKVYAITDTNFATPLAVTDMADVPFTGNEIASNSDGIYPEFKTTPGITQVIVKSGQALTPMTSVAASAGAAVAAAEAASQAATAASAASLSATAAVEMADAARQQAMEAAAAAAAVGATTDTQMVAVLNDPDAVFPQEQQIRIQGAIGAAEAASRGKTLLSKSRVAFTPDGWNKKGRGVSAIAALASTTNYRSAPVLSLNPAWTQSLTANSFSGGTAGALGSGQPGVVPTGWVEYQTSAKKVITRCGNGVLEWRALNVWSGMHGGFRTTQTFSGDQVVGVTMLISDVPPSVQENGLFAWVNPTTGAITNTVGQIDGTAAPFTSAMSRTRTSIELAAPSEPSYLLIFTAPVKDDLAAFSTITPLISVENVSVATPAQMGPRPELIPPYVPSGAYPAADAVVALDNGDYALIAVTMDGTFIPLSVSVTDGTLSLASVLGGVGRYAHIYIVPSAEYSPLDLSAFLPLSTRSGLATPPGSSHSRGIMQLAALAMGKRNSVYLASFNGGSNDRAVQIATGARRGRYEVHKGERDPDDGPGQNRSEAAYYRTYPHRSKFGWSAWINAESFPWEGPSDLPKYCLLMQWRYHYPSTPENPDPGASPELALEALGAEQPGMFRLRLITRSGTAVANSVGQPTVTHFDEILPLGWRYLGAEGIVDPNGAGYLKFWNNPTGRKNDHQLLVDTGPMAIGYSNSIGFRVREGAYANNWDQPRLVEHESIEFGLNFDALSRVTQPPPRLAA